MINTNNVSIIVENVRSTPQFTTTTIQQPDTDQELAIGTASRSIGGFSYSGYVDVSNNRIVFASDIIAVNDTISFIIAGATRLDVNVDNVTTDPDLPGGNVVVITSSAAQVIARLGLRDGNSFRYYLVAHQISVWAGATIPQRDFSITSQSGTLEETITSRLDTFRDLPIVFERKIQDYRDIKKVWTDASYTFSVPASKNNQRIFQDFERVDVDNGFDARTWKNCRIEVNTIPYLRGVLQLISAPFSNARVKEYKVQFVGELTTLSQLFGDDTLQDLFADWSFQTTTLGLANTLEGTGIVPLSSQSNVPEGTSHDAIRQMLNSVGRRLINDPTATAEENLAYGNLDIPARNIASGDNAGIDVTLNRPWIKANEVLKQIENRYGVTFNKNSGFFADPRWTNLYQILHSKSDGEGITVPVTFNEGAVIDTQFLHCTIGIRVSRNGSTFYVTNHSNGYAGIQFQLSIVPTGSMATEDYSVRALGSARLTGQTTTSGNGNSTITFTASGANDSVSFEIQAPQGFTYNAVLTATITGNTGACLDTLGSVASSGNSVNLEGDFIIGRNLPNQRVIDWLSGAWKMFNLTAQFDTDHNSDTFGQILTETLDDFYASGDEVDLTEFIDHMDYEVHRSEFYSDIQFSWADPVTLLGTAYEDQTGRIYGEARWNGTTDSDSSRRIFKEYKLELPFQQFPYDAISGSGITYPYIADDGGADTQIMPHFAYPQYTEDNSAAIGFSNISATITNYWRASKFWDMGGNNEIALLFDNEFDEYLTITGQADQIIDTTLFDQYDRYIQQTFHQKARVIKCEAVLPASIFSDLHPNDVVIWRNDRYRVNSIITDAMTGRSQIDMVSLGQYIPPGGTEGVEAEGQTGPTADAGMDQTVEQAARIQLDGSMSVAENGQSITAYSWTGPNGYTANTQNPTVSNSASTVHTGTYTLTITQTDGQMDTDSVHIAVNSEGNFLAYIEVTDKPSNTVITFNPRDFYLPSTSTRNEQGGASNLSEGDAFAVTASIAPIEGYEWVDESAVAYTLQGGSETTGTSYMFDGNIPSPNPASQGRTMAWTAGSTRRIPDTTTLSAFLSIDSGSLTPIEGTDVVLRVNISDGSSPYTIIWQARNPDITNNWSMLPSEVQETLTLSEVTTDDTFHYRAVVTDSDGAMVETEPLSIVPREQPTESIVLDPQSVSTGVTSTRLGLSLIHI